MQIPLQITFRDVESSSAVAEAVRHRVDALERFDRRIIGCRVVIEGFHRHHRNRLFHVRLELSLPGEKVVVSHGIDPDDEHEDLYTTLRHAFEIARRRVEDHARRSRGDVKAHEGQSHGWVVRLDPRAGYGFIEATDGSHVYFHRNAVVSGFDLLRVGREVAYVVQDAEGRDGPQASTVRDLGPGEPKGAWR